MKKFQLAALTGLLCLSHLASSAEGSKTSAPPAKEARPSSRLQHLAGGLPQVGQIAEMKSLGLSLGISDVPPTPAQQEAPNYKFILPRNLDRGCTDMPPYAGKYPGVHLNLPLKVQRSYINYLFISDQPERIRDDRRRTPAPAAKAAGDPGPGAVGVYARSPIPSQSTVRVLVDHTDGTKRPLRFALVWIPDKEGFLIVKKRSQSVHKDSVAAGSRSFAEAGALTAEPRQTLTADQGIKLTEATLQPDETIVVQLEFFTSGPGQLAAVVTEQADEAPASLASLDSLPILHSVVWNEEEERLGKFIDPKSDPKRYQRIKNSFQHARGHFQFPDRATEIDYKVGSWRESDTPTQLYSLFESIPGVDITVANGEKPATTDNRGKYGARVGLKFNIKQLPPGCREMALLALNRGEVYGGRHWVSDGRKTAYETYLRPGVAPGVLRRGQVCNLWRGPVRPGDQLTMWTEPMANTSVQLLYVLVPIPEGSAAGNGKPVTTP